MNRKYFKFVLFIVVAYIFLFGSNVSAQTPYYYYYNGTKKYLKLDTTQLFISTIDTIQLNLGLDIKKSNFKRDIFGNRQVKQGYIKRYWQKLTLQNNLQYILPQL